MLQRIKYDKMSWSFFLLAPAQTYFIAFLQILNYISRASDWITYSSLLTFISYGFQLFISFIASVTFIHHSIFLSELLSCIQFYIFYILSRWWWKGFFPWDEQGFWWSWGSVFGYLYVEERFAWRL